MAYIGYPCGEGAQVHDVDGIQQAVALPGTHLLEPSLIVRLFADDRHAKLSTVIFSNACSIVKLNPVAVSGRRGPEGLRYTRIRIDRTAWRSRTFHSVLT